MREKVQEAIDKIRPALQKDGGDVILVDVTDEGIVKVQLTGACKGCPMSQMTLKEGIEKFVKSEIPEIASVESVEGIVETCLCTRSLCHTHNSILGGRWN